ncbi:hypothetical protein WA538_001527 [Blastocystis sp. DL]
MAEQSKQIRINGELATKALNSLRHHAEEVEKNKQAAGSIIYLILAVKKIDERKKDCLIHCQLVHSLNENDPTMEILFVTKGESDPWAAKLRDLGQISTFMSYDQLKKRIAAKDGKAEILKTFRYILCDNRLRRGMAHLLGEGYLLKRKIVPVRVLDNDIDSISHNIRIQLGSTRVKLSGTCLSIPFSRTSMTNKEIIENYNAVMVTMLKMIPAEDVASMSLKTDQSVSFPIYEADSVIHKTPYVKEMTLEEKRKLKYKEKRLKRVNNERVKREVVPKIKPKKSL